MVVEIKDGVVTNIPFHYRYKSASVYIDKESKTEVAVFVHYKHTVRMEIPDAYRLVAWISNNNCWLTHSTKDKFQDITVEMR